MQIELDVWGRRCLAVTMHVLLCLTRHTWSHLCATTVLHPPAITGVLALRACSLKPHKCMPPQRMACSQCVCNVSTCCTLTPVCAADRYGWRVVGWVAGPAAAHATAARATAAGAAAGAAAMATVASTTECGDIDGVHSWLTYTHTCGRRQHTVGMSACSIWLLLRWPQSCRSHCPSPSFAG